MIYHIIGRILVAVIVTVLVGTACHLDESDTYGAGLEKFLAQQELRYYAYHANSLPIWQTVFVSPFIALGVFGAYEFLAFFVTRAIKRFDSKFDYKPKGVNQVTLSTQKEEP